jgi:hypothetical protein
MGDDSIRCVPESLVQAGIKFSEKALQVLSIHHDLDTFSQTLHDSLPNEKSQLSIDKFWTQWSKLLLDMAAEIENIAILLGNAAVAYVETDAAIVKAFHGDPTEVNAEIDKLKGEIKTLTDNNNTFKTQFDTEKNYDTQVNHQEQKEQEDVRKDNVTYEGSAMNGKSAFKFHLDKNGKIITLNPDGSVSDTLVTRVRLPDGTVLDSGSQKAKDMYNNS